MTNPIKQYDFTVEEVQKLFQMQDTLNSYIHPEWKAQGFNWGLAIVDECMEIHGHLGWKWWKKGYQVGLTEENRKQIQLEVIDILHFVVSSDFVHGYQDDADRPLNSKNPVFDIKYCVDRLHKAVIVGQPFNYAEIWAALARSVGLTKQQILETYTQKYVLNKFRQDHGYKDGSYVKEWVFNFNGEPGINKCSGEDNYWLEQVVIKLRKGNHSTTDENLLYSELKALYNSRLNQ